MRPLDASSITSDELNTLLRETGALLDGHFRLSSGLHSSSYVQCARLLEHPRNASRIGRALADRVRDVGADRVVSPALGGIIIGYTTAEALDAPFIFTERKDSQMTLRRGFSIGDERRVLIVEDVVTTGKSTRETAEVVEGEGGEVVGFASILNRSGQENPFSRPYFALLSLRLDTYPPEECLLCAAVRPLESPGSRFDRS